LECPPAHAADSPRHASSLSTSASRSSFCGSGCQRRAVVYAPFGCEHASHCPKWQRKDAQVGPDITLPTMAAEDMPLACTLGSSRWRWMLALGVGAQALAQHVHPLRPPMRQEQLWCARLSTGTRLAGSAAGGKQVCATAQAGSARRARGPGPSQTTATLGRLPGSPRTASRRRGGAPSKSAPRVPGRSVGHGGPEQGRAARAPRRVGALPHGGTGWHPNQSRDPPSAGSTR